MLDMSNRASLITGGAGHIGVEMALSLAELGSNIILIDKDFNGLQLAKESILNVFNAQVVTIAADLEDEQSPSKIASIVDNKFGKVDVLINNAAFGGTTVLEGWTTTFAHQSLSTWRRALEVNLTSAFALSQACISLLNQSKSASIINIGSIYGFLGPDLSLYEGTAMNNPAAYAASKGGLLQLTRWMATVLGPDIRVNAISPGGVARGQPQAFVDRYVSRTPLKRMGREEDFKGAIVYLASDMSAWVTGQNLVVDGGWSVW